MPSKPRSRPRKARKPAKDPNAPWRIVEHLTNSLDDDPLGALERGAALLQEKQARDAVVRRIELARREPLHPFDNPEPLRHVVVAVHLLYLALISEGLLDSYFAGLRVEAGRRKGATKGGTTRTNKFRKRNERWISNARALRKRHPNWSTNRIAKEIAVNLRPEARVTMHTVYRVLLKGVKNATDLMPSA